MFEHDISTSQTLYSAPVPITLSRWIHSTMNPKCRFVREVKRYRETGNENIKKRLPVVTVGALLTGKKDEEEYPKPGTGYRVTEQIKKRTGWIALDVDAKDNPELKDAARLRDQIANISEVAFAGLSVSGQGVWALVKVADPQKQAQYFQQLQADFKGLGITLDSTKGKNPNDARFYSFDPDAYVADEFKVYERLPKERPIRKPERPSRDSKPLSNGNDTKGRVEALISKIHARRIDITAGYDKWRNLGFALEDEFGEAGRKYFLAISQYHPDYSQQEAGRQYSKCLSNSGSGVGIGTFFHECQEYGITLHRHHDARRDNGLKSKYEDDDPAPYGMNPWTGEVFDERGYPSEWDTVTLNEELKVRQPQLN